MSGELFDFRLRTSDIFNLPTKLAVELNNLLLSEILYMQKLLFTGFLLFFATSFTTVNAQKVFSCNNRYDADIKVFVVSNRYDADLLVYKVSNMYDADGNKGLWYFCQNKYDARKKIWFAENKYDADLLIFFVENKYDAGWREKEKMHLLY